MNEYLKKSIELANNHDYLDRLYSVYPIANNIRRNINSEKIKELMEVYNEQDNKELVKLALKLELFPIKDSYVAFLKRYPKSIDKNPQTINRLAGIMYQLGWDKFIMNITEPKESNRQMGSKFSEWLNKKPLGLLPTPLDEFINTEENAILRATDTKAKEFAQEKFGYTRNKGLDFVARFNGKYILGEAKFLTDFGGHQNAQLEDALSTIDTKVYDATMIAILDGVVFIDGENKMYTKLINDYKNKNIMSSLLLNEFCYSIN